MAHVDTAEHTIRVGVTTNLGTPLLFETRSNTPIEALRSKQHVAVVVLNSLQCLQGSYPHNKHTAGQIETQHAAVHAYTRQYGQVTCSIIAVDYNGYKERFALADIQLLSCKSLSSDVQLFPSNSCTLEVVYNVIWHRQHATVPAIDPYIVCSVFDTACCSCGGPARLKLCGCFR